MLEAHDLRMDAGVGNTEDVCFPAVLPTSDQGTQQAYHLHTPQRRLSPRQMDYRAHSLRLFVAERPPCHETPTLLAVRCRSKLEELTHTFGAEVGLSEHPQRLVC